MTMELQRYQVKLSWIDKTAHSWCQNDSLIIDMNPSKQATNENQLVITLYGSSNTL